jgi:sigma-E factor negative regulatory protein RseB
VIPQFAHWRAAGAAAAFVLAGSSAVAVAMHYEPSDGAVAYQALPAPAQQHQAAAGGQTAGARLGLALMTEAAAACRTTAFSGVQEFRWLGPDGTSVWLADIWHQPGGQTVAEPVAGAAAAQTRAGPATMPGPSVSLDISAQQLTLMQAGYILSYTGLGSADGRVAELVAVRRPNGTLAARYWLDRQTKLPLRRQLFDNRARLVSDISFAELRIGPDAVGNMPAASTQPWPRQLGMPEIAALRAQGWPLPGALPGRMVLLAASETSTSAGQVIGLSYSDGLSVISLFVQRGELPGQLTGWQRIAIGGHDAYAVDPDDQTIAWSANGYVFTLLADAPALTVDQAIAALPQGSPMSFWDRLGRGFRRLAHWANPFR